MFKHIQKCMKFMEQQVSDHEVIEASSELGEKLLKLLVKKISHQS